ncbi:MAG: HTTM domain-containing protein [Acidimicrobiales bacterium]|nr:HTTM domain-containing protein [Acidimicrobiales bacterium]
MSAADTAYRVIDRVRVGWNRFWFTPAPVTTLTVIRTLLGFTVFCWGLSVLPDLRTFYFQDGLMPTPSYADHRLGLLQWFTSDAAVVVVFVAMMLGAVALMAGRFVRVAAPVVWITLISLELDNTSVLNAGDNLLRIWAVYFAIFALLTPSRFLDVPLWGRRGVDGAQPFPVGPTWLLRVMQLQLTVIYPATVVAKLDGDTWREGTAAIYALGLTDFERFWVPDVVRENLVLGNLMTWWTIGLELALPFLLWTKRTRWAGIILGIGMHAGFDYTMRLGFFLWAMTMGYLSFVRPDETARPLRRLAALRWRSPPEVAAPDPPPVEPSAIVGGTPDATAEELVRA